MKTKNKIKQQMKKSRKRVIGLVKIGCFGLAAEEVGFVRALEWILKEELK